MKNRKIAIAIIGAGPAGNYCAELLAGKGFDVQVFEEHSRIGEPWQCTGIVTDSVNNIVRVDEKAVINEISSIRIHSSDNFVDFALQKKNIILDRTRFDQMLAQRARKNGARFYLNSRFIGIEKKENKFIVKIENVKKKGNKKLKEFECDYVVGADGPTSSVAKTANMFGKRRFYQGIQARIKLKNENIVETFLDIGVFSWIVPENKDVARVGVVTNKGSGDFDALIEKIKQTKKIKNIKIIGKQAGIIPVYNPKTRIEKSFGKEKNKNKIFLIGDAAMQVKATSFGGIIYGLMAAECLAEAVEKNKSYQKICNRKVSRDLWLSLRIRKILNKMHARDYNKIIGLIKKEKVKKILEKHDRDFPSRFLLKLFLAEPRLAWFVLRGLIWQK